jgi:5-hydroxyisourate hydrolase
MSQLTTHILDTTKGRPAAGVTVALYKGAADENLAIGITNADGRIPDLLPAEQRLAPGIYRLQFLTNDYFERQGVAYFYPFVDIWFTVTDNSHYHVPLLLNPFGFSTYRGS